MKRSTSNSIILGAYLLAILVVLFHFSTPTSAVSSMMDGVFIPIGSCTTSRCCCSNSYPTTITSSPLTDELIVESEFNANDRCNGYQALSAVFQMVDSKTAIWVMPLTGTTWQLKWNDAFSIIQLQQIDQVTGSIDTTCLNQLKRMTTTDEMALSSREEITSFNMLFAPNLILSTSGRLTATLASQDGSHSLFVQVEQVGRSSRFDFNVYIQSHNFPSVTQENGGTSSLQTSPLKSSLLNAEFLTMHFISPTTLHQNTAVMAARTQRHCKPVNDPGANALRWSCQIKVPRDAGARIAFTYRLSNSSLQNVPGVYTRRQSSDNTEVLIDSGTLYQTETFFLQNNFATTTNTFFLGDGSEVDATTLAYIQRFDGSEIEAQALAPPVTTTPIPSPSTTTPSTTIPTTPSTTTPTTPTKPSTPTPAVTIPSDYRELFSGDWKSTGSCKSSSSCCCLSPTKDVAMTVYTPEQAKAKGVTPDGINPSNKNQIVVVGYLDSHSSCFGLKSLEGTCELNFDTRKGSCKMNGITFKASIDEVKRELSVENSMFDNCVSVAKPLFS